MHFDVIFRHQRGAYVDAIAPGGRTPLHEVSSGSNIHGLLLRFVFSGHIIGLHKHSGVALAGDFDAVSNISSRKM
jgi:hypothetical protein